MANQYSGKELDLAINGDGFFVLGDKDGNHLEFTRKGNFDLSEEGVITSKEGHFLLNADLKPVTYFGSIQNAENKKQMNIALANFEHIEKLIRKSGGYYTADEKPIIHSGGDTIVSMCLEEGQLDIAKEFVNQMEKQKELMEKRYGHLRYEKVVTIGKIISFPFKLILCYIKRLLFTAPTLSYMEIVQDSYFPVHKQSKKREIIRYVYIHALKSVYRDTVKSHFYKRVSPEDVAWKMYNLLYEQEDPYKRMGW